MQSRVNLFYINTYPVLFTYYYGSKLPRMGYGNVISGKVEEWLAVLVVHDADLFAFAHNILQDMAICQPMYTALIRPETIVLLQFILFQVKLLEEPFRRLLYLPDNQFGMLTD